MRKRVKTSLILSILLFVSACAAGWFIGTIINAEAWQNVNPNDDKILVIESPRDMYAVNEAYTPAVEPETPEQTVTVNGQEMELVPATESVGMTSLGAFRVTHYCPCVQCCGKNDGIAKSGRPVVPYYSIAVDPSVIPLGSIVYLDYGDGVLHEARADDTGGAVKGNVIDLCVGDHQTAIQYGVRQAIIYMEGEQ